MFKECTLIGSNVYKAKAPTGAFDKFRKFGGLAVWRYRHQGHPKH